MSIQQSINQTLGTVAIAGRLAPGFEQKQEIYQGKKAIEALTSAEAQARATGRTPFANELEQQRISRAQDLYSKYPHVKEVAYLKKSIPITTPPDSLDKAEEANMEAKDRTTARITQANKYRKSILLDASGQNLMVPMKESKK